MAEYQNDDDTTPSGRTLYSFVWGMWFFFAVIGLVVMLMQLMDVLS